MCFERGEQSTHRDWNVLLRRETYEDELDTMKIEEFIIDLIFTIQGILKFLSRLQIF